MVQPSLRSSTCSRRSRELLPRAERQPPSGGVRPDQLLLGEEGARAEVAVIEPTGAETLVVLRIGESQVHALIRDRMPLRPGGTVGITIRPGALHLFDAATGARL
jgi:multiple sugar transport system ATP-binding protein